MGLLNVVSMPVPSVRQWRRRSTARRVGPSRWVRVWSLIGAGIVTASAGSEAGGIATFANAGARYGYDLIWVMLVLIPALAVVQEMSVRVGAVTGKGLADLIREELPLRGMVLALLALLVANGGIILSEFIGVAAALELFGVSKYLAVPPIAFLLWYLIASGSYRRVERGFLVMGLTVLAYPVAAVLGRPDWRLVATQVVMPPVIGTPAYLFAILTVIGTTISPYLLFYGQSAVAERGVSPDDFAATRGEAWVGTIFANLTAILIMVATGATLHAANAPVNAAADAARSLVPVAGRFAGVLFGIALLGASLLTAGLLPLATAYAIAEALGWEKDVTRGWREAKGFLGLFTGLIVAGAAITLLPGLPLVPALLAAQLVNALVLPVILFALLRLANDATIMGTRRNGWGANLVAGTTLILVSGVACAYLASIVTMLFMHHPT